VHENISDQEVHKLLPTYGEFLQFMILYSIRGNVVFIKSIDLPTNFKFSEKLQDYFNKFPELTKTVSVALKHSGEPIFS